MWMGWKPTLKFVHQWSSPVRSGWVLEMQWKQFQAQPLSIVLLRGSSVQSSPQDEECDCSHALAMTPMAGWLRWVRIVPPLHRLLVCRPTTKLFKQLSISLNEFIDVPLQKWGTSIMRSRWWDFRMTMKRAWLELESRWCRRGILWAPTWPRWVQTPSDWVAKQCSG